MTHTANKKAADAINIGGPYSPTRAVILERMLKDINPASKRELSLRAARGVRNELSSRAMRREYERAQRKLGKLGML